MPVKDPVQFRDAIRAVKGKGVILLAYEGLKGKTAGDSLGKALRASPGADVHVFVGPEGGFTQDEVDLALADGAVVFGLGPRILRAEAAAAAALALVQYELGGI
jgi:16S rRNA (uracil1498-N3)-methyltransferase